MSAEELKAAIYKMLDSTNHSVVLEDIQEYIAQRKEGIIPELGCTYEEYNCELEEGEAAIQRGEYYTHEEVMAAVDEMLQKKRDAAKSEYVLNPRPPGEILTTIQMRDIPRQHKQKIR